jgi:hypothetical protein
MASRGDVQIGILAAWIVAGRERRFTGPTPKPFHHLLVVGISFAKCRDHSTLGNRFSLCQLVAAEPVGTVFFDGDPHELAARSDSGLVE